MLTAAIASVGITWKRMPGLSMMNMPRGYTAAVSMIMQPKARIVEVRTSSSPRVMNSKSHGPMSQTNAVAAATAPPKSSESRAGPRRSSPWCRRRANCGHSATPAAMTSPLSAKKTCPATPYSATSVGVPYCAST